MKVMVTGACGMLGATLIKLWKHKYNIYATDRGDYPGNIADKFLKFDLASDSYDRLTKWCKPDVIVHCAALTNVDYCEVHPEEAMTVNGESVDRFLRSYANAKMVFISSEAVFPEDIHMATEKDKPAPENIYGISKMLGEKFIKDAGRRHSAVRTTIVGKNINPLKQGFVEWIIRSVKEGKEITLFDDTLFTPITIWYFAKELEFVIRNNIRGIIHVAGKHAITKYDFGMNLCKRLGLDTNLIKKESIDTFKFKAKRSKDQSMDSSYYESTYHRNLPMIDDTINTLVKHFKVKNNG